MTRLDEMHALAKKCGLTQVPWAKTASVNPTRLNQALCEHIELRDVELDRLENALRAYIAAQAHRFTGLLVGIETAPDQAPPSSKQTGGPHRSGDEC